MDFISCCIINFLKPSGFPSLSCVISTYVGKLSLSIEISTIKFKVQFTQSIPPPAFAAKYEATAAPDTGLVPVSVTSVSMVGRSEVLAIVSGMNCSSNCLMLSMLCEYIVQVTPDGVYTGEALPALSTLTL